MAKLYYDRHNSFQLPDELVGVLLTMGLIAECSCEVESGIHYTYESSKAPQIVKNIIRTFRAEEKKREKESH